MGDFVPIYIITSISILYICVKCLLRPRRVIIDPKIQNEITSKIRIAMNTKEN